LAWDGYYLYAPESQMENPISDLAHAFRCATTLARHDFGDGLAFYAGRLPDDLVWSTEQFEAAWHLHPVERHWVKMVGKLVQTPRWQQAYGANYKYTGSCNNAMPIPQMLVPLLRWSQEKIDERLNGLLVNSYDGPNDYIGPHHDSPKGLVGGSPIVTASFGETRTFRLTKWKRRQRIAQHDFEATSGSVFVTPWNTNKGWKHEVLKRAKYHGRRISVTIRAFADGVLPASEYFEVAGPLVRAAKRLE
jgi:alkylated DNA repair dioxygenase AlkB